MVGFSGLTLIDAVSDIEGDFVVDGSDESDVEMVLDRDSLGSTDGDLGDIDTLGDIEFSLEGVSVVLNDGVMEGEGEIDHEPDVDLEPLCSLVGVGDTVGSLVSESDAVYEYGNVTESEIDGVPLEFVIVYVGEDENDREGPSGDSEGDMDSETVRSPDNVREMLKVAVTDAVVVMFIDRVLVPAPTATVS